MKILGKTPEVAAYERAGSGYCTDQHPAQPTVNASTGSAHDLDLPSSSLLPESVIEAADRMSQAAQLLLRRAWRSAVAFAHDTQIVWQQMGYQDGVSLKHPGPSSKKRLF